MESLCLVFVRMEGAPTARDETRERSPSGRTNFWSPVSSSGGNPDRPKRRRRRPTVQIEGQTTQKEFSSSAIQEFHLTGVQGLYQLNGYSKLCHLV